MSNTASHITYAMYKPLTCDGYDFSFKKKKIEMSNDIVFREIKLFRLKKQKKKSFSKWIEKFLFF